MLSAAAQQLLDPFSILDTQRQPQPNSTSRLFTSAQKQPTRQCQTQVQFTTRNHAKKSASERAISGKLLVFGNFLAYSCRRENPARIQEWEFSPRAASLF
jgi:hypothetical protein